MDDGKLLSMDEDEMEESIMSEYIETDCTVEHEGRTFEAGGAVVTADRITAYCGKDGVLTDWHGAPLGTWRAVATWPIHSYISRTMSQIEARVDGRLYTGRGVGEGLVFNGRAKRFGGRRCEV